jgi:Lycopene cyclase
MNFTFLTIDIFLLLIPFLLSLDKNVLGKAYLKFSLGAALVSAIVFSAETAFLKIFGVINYHFDYFLSFSYKELPLTQYLFNFAFSFAALGVYHYLHIRFPKNDLQKFSLTLSNLLLGICVAFLFFAYGKWYSLLTFSSLFLLLLFIEYLNKLRFMYKAYRAFAAMFIPFCICVIFLEKQGIVTFNQAETLKLTFLTAPLESYFMALSMVVLSIYMFEFFKHRAAK